MRSLYRVVVTIGAEGAILTGLGMPPASAEGPILGGGAGITVNGTLCTLTAIGHDKGGELVGFTAASCGGPGSPVAAAGGPNVGSVVAAEDSLKYAVVKFDPAHVTPTATFGGFAINAIGPDPDFRQPTCTDGAATGSQCGRITSIPGPGPGRNMSGAVFQPGDEGRPVTADNMLIGMAYGGYRQRTNPHPIVLVDQGGHWLITHDTAMAEMNVIWQAAEHSVYK